MEGAYILHAASPHAYGRPGREGLEVRLVQTNY